MIEHKLFYCYLESIRAFGDFA